MSTNYSTFLLMQMNLIKSTSKFTLLKMDEFLNYEREHPDIDEGFWLDYLTENKFKIQAMKNNNIYFMWYIAENETN